LLGGGGGAGAVAIAGAIGRLDAAGARRWRALRAGGVLAAGALPVTHAVALAGVDHVCPALVVGIFVVGHVGALAHAAGDVAGAAGAGAGVVTADTVDAEARLALRARGAFLPVGGAARGHGVQLRGRCVVGRLTRIRFFVGRRVRIAGAPRGVAATRGDRQQ